MPFVESGKLHVIGFATEKRICLAPELPTVNESLPGLFANARFGLFAPAGTPQAVIQKVLAESTRVLASPDLQERMTGQGAETSSSNSRDWSGRNSSCGRASSRSRARPSTDRRLTASALQYSGNPHEYWLGERLSGGGISQKLV
jgi:hypothetical protein